MCDCSASKLYHVSFSGRFRGNSGHEVESAKKSKMTHSDTSRPPIAALRKVYSITSSARPARNVFDSQMQHKLSDIRGKGMRERVAKAARTSARLWSELEPHGSRARGSACKSPAARSASSTSLRIRRQRS
jgi:hypothetical protein